MNRDFARKGSFVAFLSRNSPMALQPTTPLSPPNLTLVLDGLRSNGTITTLAPPPVVESLAALRVRLNPTTGAHAYYRGVLPSAAAPRRRPLLHANATRRPSDELRAARERGDEAAASALRRKLAPRLPIALLDYETALKLSEDTNCGHRNLDVLMERVESMLTMCAQRGKCEDEPGWNYEGYGCDAMVRYGICDAATYTKPFYWLNRYEMFYKYPSRGCCACGRRQKTGPAYTCGVDQRKACSELGALGLGVCESDCGRMWDMVCSRWRQLHDEESPACGDYTYFVNSDNPRGVAPPDETS